MQNQWSILMKSMSISTFKTHALQCIDQVSKSHVSIIITKRGKPIAQVIPFSQAEGKNQPGKLAHTLIHEGDILSPLGETDWQSCE
jgi:prevent-host-death family protein